MCKYLSVTIFVIDYGTHIGIAMIMTWTKKYILLIDDDFPDGKHEFIIYSNKTQYCALNCGLILFKTNG